MPADEADPALVAEYHAHVYYDPAATRAEAAVLRDRLAARFPAARLGRWHDAPVGPHPAAMYQVAFAPDLFAALVPWLLLNRGALSVLLHPETGRPRADHDRHALWMGPPLALLAERLPGDA